MIRSVIAVVLVILLALFGYFLLTDRTGRTSSEKAKDAAVRVGDTVVDQSVAAAVRVALLGEFKHDARFLHVYHTDGNVLIYGLLPDTLRLDDVTAVARKVPGVEQVEVLVRFRPGYVVSGPAGTGTEP